MKIEKTANGTALTLAISGRLDTATAPELEQEARASLADVTELTIDMTSLDYISSAGLRVLLAMQKTMHTQGRMIVTGVNETVGEVFEITGFSDILTIQ